MKGNKMVLQVIMATAPSYLASYLINGDDSGLDSAERETADSWIKRVGLGMPIGCEDAGFIWHHDARQEFPFGSDCQEYSFLVKGE